MKNIACVGAGNGGKNRIRCFHSLNTLQVICDSDPDSLSAASQQCPDVRAEFDYQNVLDSDRVEAVVLSGSIDNYYDKSRQALDAGKHLFIDQSSTQTPEQMRQLIDLAARKDRLIMVDSAMLYHDAIRFLKTMIDEKQLGDIYYASTQNTVLNSDASIMSLVAQDVSMLTTLFNHPPETVSANALCFGDDKNAGKDVAFLQVNFSGTTVSTLHVSRIAPCKERSLMIVGSKKMVVFDDMNMHEKLRVYDAASVDSSPSQNFTESLLKRHGDVAIPAIPAIAASDPLQNQCQDFITCIKNNTRPVSDGEKALAVLETIFACKQSIQEDGTRIAIKEAP